MPIILHNKFFVYRDATTRKMVENSDFSSEGPSSGVTSIWSIGSNCMQTKGLRSKRRNYPFYFSGSCVPTILPTKLVNFHRCLYILVIFHKYLLWRNQWQCTLQVITFPNFNTCCEISGFLSSNSYVAMKHNCGWNSQAVTCKFFVWCIFKLKSNQN